jgi:excisionase family DNA binding protein
MPYAVGMSQHANDQPTDMPGITRVTVEEAAKLLGLSGNAVRKRLERGSLRSEKVDGIRYVLFESDMSQHATDMPRHAEHMSNGMPGDIALMQEHLDSMNEQVEYLKMVIEKRDEEIRRKDHLLAAALERIPAIEPPAEAPPEGREEPESASPEMEGVESPIVEEKPVSWWRKLFAG